jgi:Ca2+-binding RTX toxin-like protein
MASKGYGFIFRRVSEGTDNPDTLTAGTDYEWLIGGVGDDILVGSDRSDVLLGGSGNDILTGAKGRDELDGGDGRAIPRFSQVKPVSTPSSGWEVTSIFALQTT